jgi:leader peptidase (prepilin peptidase) / N-methyltransferase
VRRAATASEPLVAAAVGVIVSLFSVWAYSPRTAFASCLLAWSMLAIAAIDARQFIVPDILSLPAIPAGLLASGKLLDPSNVGLVDINHVVGALVGGGSLWLVRAAYFRVRQREGLGLGDVKLASVAGAWVGWQGLSSVLLLAAAMALTFILILSVLRRESPSPGAKVPFGAFLAPSIWAVWAFDAYVGGL